MAGFKSGSFTKSTAGAPTTNVISGIGFAPRGLILWTSGGLVSGTISTPPRHATGWFDGTTYFTVCGSQADADPGGAAQRGVSQSHALRIINSAGTTLAECTATLDADGFTLTWTTNDAVAYIIHYAVFGEPCSVVNFAAPTGTGNFDTTGFGFQPQGVLMLISRSTAAGAASNWNDGIGAIDKDGNQWTLAIQSRNTGGPTITANYARVNQALAVLGAADTVEFEASYVSMLADGFRLNATTVSLANLCSAMAFGGAIRVGNVAKSTAAAPVDQDVTGFGFTPEGVFVLSPGRVAATTVQAHNDYAKGVIDASGGEQASAHQCEDNVASSDTYFLDRTDKALTHVTVAGAENYAADGSIIADGFRLELNPNTAVAVQLLYLGWRSNAPRANDRRRRYAA